MAIEKKISDLLETATKRPTKKPAVRKTARPKSRTSARAKEAKELDKFKAIGERIAKGVIKELEVQKRKIFADAEKKLNQIARAKKYSPLEGKAMFNGYDKYLRANKIIPRYVQ